MRISTTLKNELDKFPERKPTHNTKPNCRKKRAIILMLCNGFLVCSLFSGTCCWASTTSLPKMPSNAQWLIFTASNLHRVLNIVEKERLRRFGFDFFLFLTSFLASLELFWRTKKNGRIFCLKNCHPYNASIC